MDVSNGIAGVFVRRPLLRQVLVPIIAFIGVVAEGVTGFIALANIGVVNALFWVLDPTSIELHFRAHEGPARLVKAYAVVVQSGLVLAGLWIGETLLSATFGGQIQEELQHMKNERTIAELENHVIICGYGMFGQTIAAQFHETDRDVVVVETDETQYQRAINNTLPAVNGDARREETLTNAGVKRADTVIAAIDDSNANIHIALTVSQLAPSLKVVVRIGNEMYEPLAHRAGADRVVIPEVVSGEQVTTMLT